MVKIRSWSLSPPYLRTGGSATVARERLAVDVTARAVVAASRVRGASLSIERIVVVCPMGIGALNRINKRRALRESKERSALERAGAKARAAEVAVGTIVTAITAHVYRRAVSPGAAVSRTSNLVAADDITFSRASSQPYPFACSPLACSVRLARSPHRTSRVKRGRFAHWSCARVAVGTSRAKSRWYCACRDRCRTPSRSFVRRCKVWCDGCCRLSSRDESNKRGANRRIRNGQEDFETTLSIWACIFPAPVSPRVRRNAPN